MEKYFFSHIYGRSYFGSGGGYGSVKTLENCRVGGELDNGFVYGPEYVEPIDPSLPAKVSASGGDCIGQGRKWSETAVWSPEDREWFPVSDLAEVPEYKYRRGLVAAHALWYELEQQQQKEFLKPVTEILSRHGGKFFISFRRVWFRSENLSAVSREIARLGKRVLNTRGRSAYNGCELYVEF